MTQAQHQSSVLKQSSIKQIKVASSQGEIVVNCDYNIHFPNLVTHHNYNKKDSFSKEFDKFEKVVVEITEQKNQVDKDDVEKKLPHIKVIDDKKEFYQKKVSRHSSKRNSFNELPEVFEEKKQLEDQKQILSKLDNFVDRDQFNSKGKIPIPHFLQNNQFLHNFESPIQEIKESEEPLEQKPVDKTILEKEVQKVIVDEIDFIEKHSRKEQKQSKQEIEIISQQKVEQEGVNGALLSSLHKLHSEKVIFKKIVNADYKNDEQVIIPLQPETVNLITEPIEQRESEQEN